MTGGIRSFRSAGFKPAVDGAVREDHTILNSELELTNMGTDAREDAYWTPSNPDKADQ